MGRVGLLGVGAWAAIGVIGGPLGAAVPVAPGVPDVPGPPPAVREVFDQPWHDITSPDGLFRLNGSWIGTGGNQVDPTLVGTPGSAGGPSDALALSVAPARRGQTPYHGAEIQSVPGSEGSDLPGYGQGYYEARLQVSAVPGICASFFWIEAPRYGPHEIDLEFLTNEPWLADPLHGVLHVTLHPSALTERIELPFNPSLAMHRYGFLWRADQVSFTVDGRVVRSFHDPLMRTDAPGFIMANVWTGQRDWGGGPPDRLATSLYAEVRFAPGLASLPDW